MYETIESHTKQEHKARQHRLTNSINNKHEQKLDAAQYKHPNTIENKKTLETIQHITTVRTPDTSNNLEFVGTVTNIENYE